MHSNGGSPRSPYSLPTVGAETNCRTRNEEEEEERRDEEGCRRRHLLVLGEEEF